MAYEYQFPEKNPFRASEVTDTVFKIESRQDWVDQLFVDFGPERYKSFRKKFNQTLGIEENRLANRPNVYRKLIFSGHMGCGKSVELARYAQMIDNPESYLVVFVDLEEVTAVESIEPEDVLIALITMLVKNLLERKVRFEQDDFAAIAEELLPSEKEALREVANEYGLEAEAKASVGWKFWQFLTVEGNLKGAYSRSNKTTQVVRQALKTNPKPALLKLNNALKGLRSSLEKQQQGKDILFIIDGLEKCNPSVYESLFVRDVRMITGIDTHIISTVPIRTYYQIQYQGTKDIFKSVLLAMLRINPENIALLEQLVLKRVDQSLFGAGILPILIAKSGGCPRILLKLVHLCIEEADGALIQLSIAEKVIRREGMERWRVLTQEHRDILKSGQFHAADPVFLDLLQSLALLEYNGDTYDREINPLIQPFVDAMP